MPKSRKGVRQTDDLNKQVAKKTKKTTSESQKQKRKEKKRSRRSKLQDPKLYVRGFFQMVCSPAGCIFSVPMVIVMAYWRQLCRFCKSIDLDVNLDPDTKIWLLTDKIFPGYKVRSYATCQSLEKRQDEFQNYVQGVWSGDIEDFPGYSMNLRVSLVDPSDWMKNCRPGYGFDILDKLTFKNHRVQFENFVSACQTIFDAFKQYGPARSTKIYRISDETSMLSNLERIEEDQEAAIDDDEEEQQEDALSQWLT